MLNGNIQSCSRTIYSNHLNKTCYTWSLYGWHMFVWGPAKWVPDICPVFDFFKNQYRESLCLELNLTVFKIQLSFMVCVISCDTSWGGWGILITLIDSSSFIIWTAWLCVYYGIKMECTYMPLLVLIAIAWVHFKAE